ncbi:MAG: hypothetical protein MJY54_01825 [archaeon]|nr:hypothetical protein [archaeon]
MGNYSKHDIRGFIVDMQVFLPDMIEEKVRQLLVELEMIEENFDREVAIIYLSSNYSSNKHLAMTILRGMCDSDIKKYISTAKLTLQKEIASRHH